ncbi:hypothetical protein BH20ACI1_BH20ACI1_17580 [soil metagenome]
MSKKTAIQGDHGSFAEDAAITFLGENCEIVFCPTLEDLRMTIEKGNADFAVLPIENSLVGKVLRTNHFLQTVSWQTIDILHLQIR